MKNSHPLLTIVLGVVGLIVVGAVAWVVIKALLGLLFYLIVGAVVVGGAVYLYGKTKGSITGRGR
ncbi:MAG TPA: hypothetical protein VF869_09615 [Jatrophihabitantaceae bacterium]